MHSGWAATGLIVFALSLWGCGSGETSIDGIWNVDFGNSGKGAMKLAGGRVHAFCYGDVTLGTYSVKDDAVEMFVRFNPGEEETNLSGTIVSRDDAHFVLQLARSGVSLPFESYTGDCSEVKFGR